MFTMTWLLGFVAAIAALTICRAEARNGGSGGTDFDKPLRRALSTGLAAASLGLLVFYAMLGDGVVVPLISVVLIGGAGVFLGRLQTAKLAQGGGVAFGLALIGFACVIAAFQQVYGDFFFGFDDPFAR